MTAHVLMLVCARAEGPLPVKGVDRRREYRSVREALDAELLDLGTLDRSAVGRRVQRVLGTYVGLAVIGALRVLRGGVDLVLCDNENEALVLAVLLKLLRRRVPLVTLAVTPAARKKTPLFLLAKAQTHIDLWLAHSSVHADLLVGRYGIPVSRVQVLPFHADQAYFDPTLVDRGTASRPTPRRYVLAIGRQHRDYPTLVAAAEGLDVDVVIDAGSSFSRSPDLLTGRALPAGVHLVSLSTPELRDAYALCEVVVAPTLENDFGAGGTTLLEGMAMARPVVTTRSAGNGDAVSDRRSVLRGLLPRPSRGLFGALYAGGSPDARGPHGFYVPPGDVGALRGALRYLLEHPDEAAVLGSRGRALVVDGLSTDHFVDRVVAAVHAVLARSRAGLPQP